MRSAPVVRLETCAHGAAFFLGVFPRRFYTTKKSGAELAAIISLIKYGGFGTTNRHFFLPSFPRFSSVIFRPPYFN